MSSIINFKEIIASINQNIIKRGESSRKVSDGSVCCVEFKNLKYSDISSSQHLQSTVATITIGSGSKLVDLVIEYCVQLMTLTEESMFSVNHALINLEFTAVLESAMYKPYIFQMPDSEKLSFAYRFKEQGVLQFNSKCLEESFFKFRRSLQYILSIKHSGAVGDAPELNSEDVTNLIINIYNNMALIQLNLKNYQFAASICFNSISIQPNVKAFYRRALAYTEQFEYDQAENDLMEALKLDKENKAVLKMLATLREKDKDNRDKYRETVVKMFS